MGHPTAIFLSPPDPNYICAICLDVFDDPVSLLHCGHTFCRSCLETSLEQSIESSDDDSDSDDCAKYGRNCPECRTAIDVSGHREGGPLSGKFRQSNNRIGNGSGEMSKSNGNIIHSVRVIQSAIGNCQVRCKNSCKDGEEVDHRYVANCVWTGKLSDWPIHASRECRVEMISCPVSGCTHRCPRKDMDGHIGSKECISEAVSAKVKAEVEQIIAAVEEEAEKKVVAFMERQDKKMQALKMENEKLEERLKIECAKRRVCEENNDRLRREVKVLKRLARQSPLQQNQQSTEAPQNDRAHTTSSESSVSSPVVAAQANVKREKKKRKKKKAKRQEEADSHALDWARQARARAVSTDLDS